MSAPSTWSIGDTIRVFPLRTPTLPPATHTNAVLIGSQEAVLIEPASPYPDELGRLAGALEELARTMDIRVTRLFCTHHHADHVGGAMAMREALGVPLVAHPITAELLRGSVTFDEVMREGETLTLRGPTESTVSAIHTPGHAPGHLCFAESSTGWLAAGDMVAGTGTILVDPDDGNMGEYIDSLERLRTLGMTGLIPAHGPLLPDAEASLSRYVAHRLHREQKVVAALRSLGGRASLESLLPLAYDDVTGPAIVIAERSLLAHLQKLDRDGIAEERGGRYRLR